MGPSPIYDRYLGAQSWAYKHSCSECMSAVAVSCPEGIFLLHIFAILMLSNFVFLLLLPWCMYPEPEP